MARTKAPGTYTTNGVHCTMDPPFSKAETSTRGEGGGEYGANKAPFGKPQDLGNGGIPTKFYDGMAETPAKSESSAGASTPIGITKRNIGERRFQNPK